MYLPIIMISLAVFSQSCDTSKVVISELDSSKIEKTFTVNIGDTVKIQMTANPSTGYKWENTSKIKPKTVEFVVKDYKIDPEKAQLIGAAGTDVWIYKAVKPGTLFIQYKYTKLANKEVAKEKYFKIVVNEKQ